MQKKNQVLIWMVIAMVLSYLPWYNFSAVLKYIAAEFNLNASDTGNIIACFQAGYVVVVLITGWLADKIGPKRVIMYATLLTAIFSTAFVFIVTDKLSIMIMRMIIGCACGAIYAPGMALLASWFPPNERGGALGAYTGALTAASAGGYFIAGPIAAEAGWRTGMLWTSIPVFLAFLIVLFFVQDRPAETAKQFDGPQPAPEGGYGGAVLINSSYMGHMWELYAFWGWIGPFMVAASTATGMHAAEAQKFGGMIAACIVLAGAPAVWIMGKVADKLGRTKTIMICAIASLVPQFFFGRMYGMGLVPVGLVGAWIGFWVIADSAIYKAGLTEMTAARVRTTMLGVQSAIGFSMTILAPIAFGKILMAYNPGATVATESTVWGPAFMSLGIGALVAPIMALILRGNRQAVLMCNGKK